MDCSNQPRYKFMNVTLVMLRNELLSMQQYSINKFHDLKLTKLFFPPKRLTLIKKVLYETLTCQKPL